MDDAAILTQNQKRLNNNEISELVQSYRSGSTIENLAEQWRIHRTTVLNHQRQQGIKRRQSGPKLNEAQVRKLIKQCKSGKPLSQLGEQYNVDPATIRRHLKRPTLNYAHQDTTNYEVWSADSESQKPESDTEATPLVVSGS